ncbi:UDP-N-acetylmuramate dehydrogenase [Rhodohalobacter halophilus]|uniref:UDP-N-acetylmuramate dehydrogenase n=1 Tax=Rhodohalobacter halophilus TaxID=1812810 RepID=UPI00083FA4E8|nr:UDP-N-acetylmuramate dehydrogenase [Rhodohalobacter halophilus]
MSKLSTSADHNSFIKSNVDLRNFNTLGVAATADTFYEIKKRDQLSDLFDQNIFQNSMPVILGGGSNVLIKSDLTSPVLKVSIPGISVVEDKGGKVTVEAGAGVLWHDLVTWCVKKNFGGIENLALIPGTAGAAPIQNIGAYGVELKDVFQSLDAFMIESGEFKTFQPEECHFGYRDSIFKNELKGKAIVTNVRLTLSKPPHTINTEYYALENHLKKRAIFDPVIRDVYDAVVEIRQSKLPDPKLIGNAGSFFKNPIVSNQIFEKIKRDYPDVPSFPVDNHQVKVPAGWLIEQAGWKGKRVGNVGTYKNQALVIVNHGGATGEEIYNYAMTIKHSVEEKFGIELVPEVNVVE